MSVLLSLLSALCLCGYNSSFCNCTSLKLYVCGCKSVCTYDICSFFCSDSKESPSTALGVVCGTFCVASSVFFLPLGVESGGVGVDEMQQTMFKAQTS